MISLPATALHRILSYLPSSTQTHLVSSSKSLFDAVKTVPVVPCPSIVKQQTQLSLPNQLAQTPSELILQCSRVVCKVCSEPLFDTDIKSKSTVVENLRNFISLSHHTPLTESCPCCPETDPAPLLAFLPSPKHSAPWHCPNKEKGCFQVYCSRLCGSPIGTVVTCDTEDECGEDSHGCILCFAEYCDVMEGDAGKYECVRGLDGDDDDEDGEDDVDSDDLFGDADDLGDNENEGASIRTPAAASGDNASVRLLQSRQRPPSEEDEIDLGASSRLDNPSVLKALLGGTSSRSHSQRRKILESETKWWSAAAKKCRERGAERDECICGECDLFNDSFDSE
ncbi:hypothetical protein BDR26DRAFT_854254 [Obelidium mucronatum]|nr:hypothetical protein BDR26DRAFT_854254 [Obelidium mucronatum]